MIVMNCDPCIVSRAFEQAGRGLGQVFSRKGDIDIEKIKQSKYFRALLQKYNIKLSNKLVCNINP
jgi:hypothetical protein